MSGVTLALVNGRDSEVTDVEFKNVMISFVPVDREDTLMSTLTV